jgi:hypothetical protein
MKIFVSECSAVIPDDCQQCGEELFARPSIEEMELRVKDDNLRVPRGVDSGAVRALVTAGSMLNQHYTHVDNPPGTYIGQ